MTTRCVEQMNVDAGEQVNAVVVLQIIADVNCKILQNTRNMTFSAKLATLLNVL